MKILTICGLSLESYEIYLSETQETVLYASSELTRYVYKAWGVILTTTNKRGGRQIVLGVDPKKPHDGFSIECSGGSLFITGGSGRGVLYGVYEFLERFVGWRFFAGEMCLKGTETGRYIAPVEKLLEPVLCEIPEGYSFSDAPVLHFRDMFGHAAVSEDWCAKNRINGDIWRLKNMTERLGGAESFALSGGHSFNELMPEEKYYAEHPEYYALVDGKRKAGNMSQLCLTATGLAEEVAKNVLEILREHPTAKWVSVSQNDNDNFCSCEACVKAEREMGRGNLLFSFINKVAAIVYKERPDVKIHTYAYESTIQDCTIPLRQNILLQYCLRPCRAHALNDPDCAINRKIAARLKNLGKNGGELFVYDYRSGEMQTFMPVPDLNLMRGNMRFLADCGVRGIYAETDIFCANTPCTEELRAYVTAKLMWNPYMSEEKFERHVTEFLQGYYGDGYGHIRNYLELWEREARFTHFDSVTGIVADNDGNDLTDKDGYPVKCRILRPERMTELIGEMESELKAAYEAASYVEKPRVDMLFVAPLWYRLYHTMEDVTEHGSEEEKRKIVEDNRRLCSLMRLYCMKYTVFIGMTETTNMYSDFTLPPSKWNYWGRNSKINIFGSTDKTRRE